MDLEANEVVEEKKEEKTSFKSPGDDNNETTEYWDWYF